MFQAKPGIAVVTRKTRLAGLLARYVTAGQAKFMLAHAHEHERLRHPEAKARMRQVKEEADLDRYKAEDQEYQAALTTLQGELDFDLPLRFVDREFLPNFDFGGCQVVVVVGQDGLVANTAKYVGNLPIVAVNPDPLRIDGVLLPFKVSQARRAVRRVLDGRHQTRAVTLAEVQLNDGQRLLAFNDFFVGAASHVSARYTLTIGERLEPQSSSGILVSTGAGSTGWFSSVFNMVQGIAAWQGAPLAKRVKLRRRQTTDADAAVREDDNRDEPDRPNQRSRVELAWEDRRLLWAVREPFVSKHSRADLIAGMLTEGEQLVVESLMPGGGVIFSDGVEADFLTFNSGTIARIGVAEQCARLVVG